MSTSPTAPLTPTTSTTSVASVDAAPGGRGATAGVGVTQARVLRAEWTKFRSLRSPLITLLIASGLIVGLGALISALRGGAYDTMTAAERATFDPIAISLGGLTFAELAIGVLGVLLMTGEYATGMIRATLTAVPRRLPVLWAKVTITFVVAFVVTLVATLAAFLLGQAILNGHGLGVGLGADGALRSVVGAGLAIAVVAVIGLAIGTLLRNTAAGISTFVAVFFVVPPLMSLLPDSWNSAISPYLPSNAAGALFGSSMSEETLAPWTGFAVLCGYAVVLVAAAAWQLRRRDA
ncbi:MAG: ABC transporter permease subunit [Nocardioides sp.]|uniref:ABC transporter permease subunit n=1 Tax=Nocardioides sp. TaxID=35761 RepID=UPI0039E5D94F